MLTRNGPLKGVRVIEMAGIGPAPFAVGLQKGSFQAYLPLYLF